MSKHTPGPWGYLRSSAAGRYIVSAENMPLDICVLSNRDKSQDEINANAELIAAAPDLLDVAEMVLALATIDTPPELIKAATAAIAKARGAV